MTTASDFPDWGRFLQPTNGILVDNAMNTSTGSFDYGPFQVQGFNSVSIFLTDNNSTFVGTMIVIQASFAAGASPWQQDTYNLSGPVNFEITLPLLGGAMFISFAPSSGHFSSNGLIWAFVSTAPASDMNFMTIPHIQNWNTWYPTRVPEFISLSAEGQFANLAEIIAAPTVGAWWIFGFDVQAGGVNPVGLSTSTSPSGIFAIANEPGTTQSGSNNFGRPFRTTTAVYKLDITTAQTDLIVLRYSPGP